MRKTIRYTTEDGVVISMPKELSAHKKLNIISKVINNDKVTFEKKKLALKKRKCFFIEIVKIEEL